MARRKARVDFLLTVIELLFLSLTVDALQGKTCHNSLLLEGVGQFEPRFQGEGVVAREYFLVSAKLDRLCYLTVFDNRVERTATVRSTVLNEHNTQYSRLSNWFNNRFDNRLYRVYKHLTGCQTGLTTGLTTGCIV